MAAEISTITAILEDAREDFAGSSQVQAQAQSRPEASAPAPVPAPQNEESDVEENPIHVEEKTKDEVDEDVIDHRDFKLTNAGRLIFFALAVLTGTY
jgi:hypothetical protein